LDGGQAFLVFVGGFEGIESEEEAVLIALPDSEFELLYD